MTTPGQVQVPGPVSSVLSAILRANSGHPFNPADPTQRRYAWISPSSLPTLPSLVAEQVFMPEYALLDANVQTSGFWSTLGLTGATAPSRYVGGTTGGAPTSGSFIAGDWVIDGFTPNIWICTATGSPGTWVAAFQPSTAYLKFVTGMVADNGGTDNAGALQAALNAAPSGGAVTIPAATSYYGLGSTVTIPSGVTLRGMGYYGVRTPGSTVIPAGSWFGTAFGPTYNSTNAASNWNGLNAAGLFLMSQESSLEYCTLTGTAPTVTVVNCNASASATVTTGSSVTGVTKGAYVTGTGIPSGTFVLSVTPGSPNQIQLSTSVTISSVNLSFTCMTSWCVSLKGTGANTGGMRVHKVSFLGSAACQLFDTGANWAQDSDYAECTFSSLWPTSFPAGDTYVQNADYSATGYAASGNWGGSAGPTFRLHGNFGPGSGFLLPVGSPVLDFTTANTTTKVPNSVYASALPVSDGTAPAGFSYTANVASPCVFTATASNYTAGTVVVLSGGTSPTGFTNGTHYYVAASPAPTANTFSLAAAPGGTALNNTGSTGNGTVTAVACTYITVGMQTGITANFTTGSLLIPFKRGIRVASSDDKFVDIKTQYAAVLIQGDDVNFVGAHLTEPLSAVGPSGVLVTAGAGTATLTLASVAGLVPGSPVYDSTAFAYTATSASPCVFTATGSAYPNGTPIVLSGGTAPTGFVNGTVYYVVSASGATFSLAASVGGAAINSTSTGNGTATGQLLASNTYVQSVNQATSQVTLNASATGLVNNTSTLNFYTSANIIHDAGKANTWSGITIDSAQGNLAYVLRLRGSFGIASGMNLNASTPPGAQRPIVLDPGIDTVQGTALLNITLPPQGSALGMPGIFRYLGAQANTNDMIIGLRMPSNLLPGGTALANIAQGQTYTGISRGCMVGGVPLAEQPASSIASLGGSGLTTVGGQLNTLTSGSTVSNILDDGSGNMTAAAGVSATNLTAALNVTTLRLVANLTGQKLKFVGLGNNGPTSNGNSYTTGTIPTSVNYNGPVFNGDDAIIDRTTPGLWYTPGGSVAGRADINCGTTNGSATVTDTAIVSGDLHKSVTGPGIPANSYVGTVTAGTSFLLSSSPSSQVNVNATATSSTATLTVGANSPTDWLNALTLITPASIGLGTQTFVPFTVTTTLTNGQPSGSTLAVTGSVPAIANNNQITVADGQGNTQTFAVTPAYAGGAGNIAITSATVTLQTGSNYAASAQGTYTIPANATALSIKLVGAGGGGGAGGSSAGGGGSGGGGGGAGTSKDVVLTGLTGGNTIVVSPGLGGAGGTAVANTTGNPGYNGTSSQIQSGTQSITTASVRGGSGGSGGGASGSTGAGSYGHGGSAMTSGGGYQTTAGSPGAAGGVGGNGGGSASGTGSGGGTGGEAIGDSGGAGGGGGGGSTTASTGSGGAGGSAGSFTQGGANGAGGASTGSGAATAGASASAASYGAGGGGGGGGGGGAATAGAGGAGGGGRVIVQVIG